MNRNKNNNMNDNNKDNYKDNNNDDDNITTKTWTTTNFREMLLYFFEEQMINFRMETFNIKSP